MKKILLICSALTLLFSLQAQNPTFQWGKSMGGVSNENGNAIAVDASGNVYSTGSFQGTADFDPGPSIANLTSAGSLDIFISKLDANGNFIWAKSLGSVGGDLGQSIALDATGNVVVVGNFSATVDFDPGVGTFNLTSNGNADVFILKLDGSGNFVWAGSFGGTTVDQGISIATDLAGNVYATGFFQLTADFDVGPGTFTLASAGTNDIFAVKLDAGGNFMWAKSIGAAATDGGNGIAVDASSNVYLTGFFQGTVDFDPGPSTFNLISAGSNDIFVTKLDGSGNFMWAGAMGSVGSDIGNSIAVDASGNVYTTGVFLGSADFDPGVATTTLTSAGSNDIFVSKLNSSGAFVWADGVGGTGNDQGLGITVDVGGNIYYTGLFVSFGDFDPGVATTTLTSAGSNDIFLSKLNPAGSLVWALSMGGVGADNAKSVRIDNGGKIYTVGSFASTMDVDPGVPVTNLTSVGLTDVLVHKMSQCALTTATAITQSVTCIGLTNGAATVNATGGPFTYTWMPSGGNATTASGLGSGNYTLAIVNNTCGSIFNQTVNIAQPPAFTLTAVANGTAVCIGNSSTLTASGSGGTGLITYTWVAGPTNSVYVTGPSITTIYTVNITDANNCPGSQTVSLVVNPLPTIAVNSGSICSGQSFTMVPSGANTYTFQGGSAIVSPTTNTSYTVVGTSTDGCVSAAPAAVANITVGALPTVTLNSGSICLGQSFTLVPGGAVTYTFNGGGPVVSPTITSSYSVTGTGTNGCVSNPATVSNVTVNAIPVITVNSGSICAGQAFTMVPGGANSYTFQGGSAIVSPTINSSYTVVGTSSAGCTSGTFATSNVTVNAIPSVSAVSSSSALCINESATLTGSGANTYSWSSGGTATTEIVTPTVTTSYTLTGTDAIGCSNTVVITQSVDASCVGIQEHQADLSFNVYPNPSSGIVNIEVQALNNDLIHIQIINQLGQVVLNESTNSKLSSFNIEKLSNGIYFVILKQNNAVRKLKIIKE